MIAQEIDAIDAILNVVVQETEFGSYKIALPDRAGGYPGGYHDYFYRSWIFLSRKAAVDAVLLAAGVTLDC